MTEEAWKKIEDHPDYEVSSHGRVRRIETGKVLSPGVNNRGYHVVNVSTKGKRLTLNVHDIVARAHVPGYKEGHTVQHKDHKRTNNRATNLEWLSKAANYSDGRVTKEKARSVLADLRKNRNTLTIAKKHKVSLAYVLYMRRKLREKKNAKA